MSATLKSPTRSPTASKPLWAALAVLGVAVLAMGGALIHIQTQPEEPSLAVLATTAAAPSQAASSPGAGHNKPLPAASR
jgi:anti-sigma-K factor RskA